MSGGSYNYLENALPWAIEEAKNGELVAMVRRLQELYETHFVHSLNPILNDCNELVIALQAAHKFAMQLGPVFHAVEWRDSSDWGDDQMFEAFDKYAAERTPISWVQD